MQLAVNFHLERRVELGGTDFHQRHADAFARGDGIVSRGHLPDHRPVGFDRVAGSRYGLVRELDPDQPAYHHSGLL